MQENSENYYRKYVNINVEKEKYKYHEIFSLNCHLCFKHSVIYTPIGHSNSKWIYHFKFNPPHSA